MGLWRFEAIGTVWEIETEQPLDAGRDSAVRACIAAFDAEWSRFRPDSVVARLATGGTAPAPADAGVMLEMLQELSEATGGAVTPLAGDSLVALGYDPALSLRAGDPKPAPAGWTRMLHWSTSELTLTAPATIDVGALGKGRLVDLVTAELAGVDGRVVVDASGDLRVVGGRIRVALEHPYDPARAIGVVEIADEALCASATNRRAWGHGLHHIVDGRTGLPVREWAATWAIAPETMRADAAATALFFDGGAELAERWGVQWVRMGTDGRVERSAGFPGELFVE